MYHQHPTLTHAKPARVCLVLLLMALCIAGSARANLITNGTFDSNANGWTAVTSGGGFQAATGNPVGSFLLNAFGAATSDPYLEQTVNGLNPGQTYTLSWELLHHSNTQTAPSFGAFLDPTGAASGPNGLALLLLGYSGPYTSKPWVSHQVSFVATAISHTIRFAAELDTRTSGITTNTDVSYFIDNITLTGVPLAGNPVPEPGTVLLLGAGLSAVLWMRRRTVLRR